MSTPLDDKHIPLRPSEAHSIAKSKDDSSKIKFTARESVWKNRAFKREGLLLSYHEGTVTMKRASQGFFQKLFGANQPNDTDYEIIDEKKFHHISKKTYEDEVLKMNQRYYKYNSLKKLLNELEKDFDTAEKNAIAEQEKASTLSLSKAPADPVLETPQTTIQENTSPTKSEFEAEIAQESSVAPIFDETPNQPEMPLDEIKHIIDEAVDNKAAVDFAVDDKASEDNREAVKISGDVLSDHEISDEVIEKEIHIPLQATDSEPLTKPQSTIATELENAEKLETIASLRSELQHVLGEIAKQENNSGIKSYLHLQNSISMIKKAVADAFTALNTLELLAEDPGSSEELQNAFKDVRSYHSRFNDGLKRTLVEEKVLKDEIDDFTNNISLFSDELQTKWFDFLETKNSFITPQISLTDEVKNHKQEVDKVIASICAQHSEKTGDLIDIWTNYLENDLKPKTGSSPNDNVTAAEIRLKQIILENRQAIWKKIREENKENGVNLTKIAELQKKIVSEQEITKSLVTMLNPPAGFFDQIGLTLTSWIPPLKALWNWTPKVGAFYEKQSFDAVSLSYAEGLKKELISELEYFQNHFPTGLHAPHNKDLWILLYDSDELLKSDLDTYLDLISDSYDKMGESEKAINLRTKKEVFTALVDAQRSHNRSFAKRIQDAYQELFTDSIPPNICQFVTESKHLIETSLGENLDLENLSNEWNQARMNGIQTTQQFDRLLPIVQLYKQRFQIGKQREIECDLFTGKEKESGKECLERHRTMLRKLDLNFNDTWTSSFHNFYKINDDFITSLINTLYDINIDKDVLAPSLNIFYGIDKDFAAVSSIEKEKKSHIQSIHQDIDNFAKHVAHVYDPLISQIEKHYSIQLKIKDDLKKEIEELNLLKRSGIISTGFRKSDQKIEDMTLETLPYQAQNVKNKIDHIKQILDFSKITEIPELIKTYQKEYSGLKNQIPYLVGAAPQGDLIPRGLSNNDLPRLQFYKAKLAEETLNSITERQKNLLATQPAPAAIFQRLNTDIKEIKDQTKHVVNKSETLPLLSQIAKLPDGSPEQHKARQAYFGILTDRMAEHTEEMTVRANQFKDFPLIKHETIALLERVRKTLDDRVKNLPAAIQAHAKDWTLLEKEDGSLFKAPSNLSIDALTIPELSSYEKAIDHLIEVSSKHMSDLRDGFESAMTLNKRFDAKIADAQKYVKQLDNEDKLLAREDLKVTIENFKSAKEQYAAQAPIVPPAPPVIVAPQPPVKKGWFSWRAPKVEKAPKPRTITEDEIVSGNALYLISQYNKKMNWAAKQVEGAIRQAKLHAEQDIPDQLAICQNPEISKELQERFKNAFIPKVEETIKRLRNLVKMNQLAPGIEVFISPKSKLYVEIVQTVNDKIKILEDLKEGHMITTSSWWSGTKVTTIPAGNLNAAQMKQYQRKFRNIEFTIQSTIDDVLFIDDIIELNQKIDEILFADIPNEVYSLRAQGFFSDAYDFENKAPQALRKLQDWKLREEKVSTYFWNTNVEKKLIQKVGSLNDLKALKTVLENCRNDLEKTIKNAKPKRKTPPSPDAQLKKLMALRDNVKKESNLYFNLSKDISNLKSKMISQVEHTLHEHQQELKELKDSINEVYCTYDLEKIVKQDSIQKLIDDQIKQFQPTEYKYETDKPYLDGIFSGTHRFLTDLDAKEILKFKPDIEINKQIINSQKTITQQLDYKKLMKLQHDYEKILKKTQESIDQLDGDGKYYYAQELEKELLEAQKANPYVKDRFDAQGKPVTPKQIANNDDFEDLLEILEVQTTHLKKAREEFTNKPEMKIEDQIAKIDPARRERLAKHLIENINGKVAKQKKAINETKEKVQNIKHSLAGFPREWTKMIITTFDAAEDKINEAASGLTRAGNYLVWTTNFSPLRDLNVTDLQLVDKNLSDEIKNCETISGKFYLKYMEEQLSYLGQQIEDIKQTKNKWAKENSPSVKELDALLDKINQDFKTYFSNVAKKPADLPAEILKIINEISSKTSEIAKRVDEITEKKAKSWIELVQARNNHLNQLKSSPNPDTNAITAATNEYEQAVKEFRTETESIIDTHIKDIEAYVKKDDDFQAIKNINDKLQSHFPGNQKLMTWKNGALKKHIEQKIKQLKELRDGLPEINAQGLSWIPYNQLSAKGLATYGKIINTIAEKDESVKTEPLSILGELKQFLNLEGVNSDIEKFVAASKQISQLISSTDTPKSTKLYLESALKSQQLLVQGALQNMSSDNLYSIESFRTTLHQSQISLHQALHEKNKPAQGQEPMFSMDSWTLIHYDEIHGKANKERRIEANAKKIITAGEEIGYPNQYNPQHAVNFKNKALLDEVRDAKQLINETQLQTLNEFKEHHFDETNPSINIFNNIKTGISQKTIKDLNSLASGLPSDNAILRHENIKNFQDLLSYRNAIYHTVCEAKKVKAEIQNINEVFWINQLKNATGVRKASIQDEDFVLDENQAAPAASANVVQPAPAAAPGVSAPVVIPPVVLPPPIFNVEAKQLIDTWNAEAQVIIDTIQKFPYKEIPVSSLPPHDKFLILWKNAEIFKQQKLLCMKLKQIYGTFIDQSFSQIPNANNLKTYYLEALNEFVTELPQPGNEQQSFTILQNTRNTCLIQKNQNDLKSAQSSLRALHHIYESLPPIIRDVTNLFTEIGSFPVFEEKRKKHIIHLLEQMTVNYQTLIQNTRGAVDDLAGSVKLTNQISQDLKNIYNQFAQYKALLTEFQSQLPKLSEQAKDLKNKIESLKPIASTKRKDALKLEIENLIRSIAQGTLTSGQLENNFNIINRKFNQYDEFLIQHRNITTKIIDSKQFIHKQQLTNQWENHLLNIDDPDVDLNNWMNKVQEIFSIIDIVKSTLDFMEKAKQIFTQEIKTNWNFILESFIENLERVGNTQKVIKKFNESDFNVILKNTQNIFKLITDCSKFIDHQNIQYWESNLQDILNYHTPEQFSQLEARIKKSSIIFSETNQVIEIFSQKYTAILTSIDKITGGNYSIKFPPVQTKIDLLKSKPHLSDDDQDKYKASVTQEIGNIESSMEIEGVQNALKKYHETVEEIKRIRKQSRKAGTYTKNFSELLASAQKNLSTIKISSKNSDFQGFSIALNKITEDLKKKYDLIIAETKHKKTDLNTYLLDTPETEAEHKNLRLKLTKKIKRSIEKIDLDSDLIVKNIFKNPTVYCRELIISIEDHLKDIKARAHELISGQEISGRGLMFMGTGLVSDVESVPIEKLTISQFLDYQKSTSESLSKIQNEVKPILDASKVLITFEDLHKEIEKNALATRNELDSVKNYFYLIKINEQGIKLQLIKNKLFSFRNQEVPLQTIIETAKQFEEQIKQYKKTLEEANKNKVMSQYMQLKLAKEDLSHGVQFEQSHQIYVDLRTSVTLKLQATIKKVKDLKNAINNFEPKIKNLFYSCIDKKVIELESLIKNEVQICALNPKELQNWLSAVTEAFKVNQQLPNPRVRADQNTPDKRMVITNLDEILAKLEEIAEDKKLNEYARSQLKLHKMTLATLKEKPIDEVVEWRKKINKIIEENGNSVDKFIASLALEKRERLVKNYNSLLTNPNYAAIKTEEEAKYQDLLERSSLMSLDLYWDQFETMYEQLNRKLNP